MPAPAQAPADELETGIDAIILEGKPASWAMRATICCSLNEGDQW